MTAFFYHLTYDFRTGLRDRSLMLMNYLFPLFFYALMGALMGGINPGFLKTMIPAMIVIAMMTGEVLGLPNPIVSARELGIFRSFKINGVPALNIVTVPVISSMLHTIVVTAIITATAPVLFKAPLPMDWGYFILVALLANFALAGAGVLIGIVSPNSRSTILVAQLIFLPSMMLSGMMFPTSQLPETLRRIALLLPATHAMNAWSSLAYGLTPAIEPTASMVVLLLGGLLSFCLALYLFSWDNQNRRRQRAWMIALVALLPYLASAVLF
jgi:ABC-2 type transport system permease protein